MEHTDFRLKYGLDKETEKSRYIHEVQRGLLCNCKCPICGQDLVAKTKGEKRVPHFAHNNGAEECKGARMSMLHRLAQEILQEESKVLLPAYNGKFVQHDAKLQVFDDVTLEELCKDEVSRRRPDCIGKVLSDGIEIWVEIYCTNPINEERRADIKRREQYCIEIDLSDLLNTDYTKESVRERLLNKSDDRKWICHPVWDKEEEDKEEEERLKKEAERKALEERQRAIDEALRKGAIKTISEAKPEIQVPQFTGTVVEPKETWHISEPKEKHSHAVPETPETRDWLMWIKSIYSDSDGRKKFYQTLEKEFTKVNFKNSHPIVVNDAETKINELLVAITIHHIETVNKIYLEFLIVLRIIEFLNKRGAYDLGKVFVQNETLRNTVLKIIKQLQSVTKIAQEQSIRTLPVFQEAEDKEAIMQILTICNIVK